MKELPQKINSQKELLECLIFLERTGFLIEPELLQIFFQLLREYYEFKGKKLIFIWDQLNELYQKSCDSTKRGIFKAIDNDKCFHCRLVSASNTNENMINRNSTLNITFEINPFLVFANKSEGNENELFELVLAEAIYVRPSDILPNQIYIYAKQVFELINESIIEYLYYKKQKFSSKTFEEAKKTYLENRKNSIRSLEINFRQQFFQNAFELISYYKSLRKLLTFQEYLELEKKNDGEKVDFFSYSMNCNFYFRKLI